MSSMWWFWDHNMIRGALSGTEICDSNHFGTNTCMAVQNVIELPWQYSNSWKQKISLNDCFNDDMSLNKMPLKSMQLELYKPKTKQSPKQKWTISLINTVISNVKSNDEWFFVFDL